METPFEMAMQEVQRTVDSQPDDNRLTATEAHSFQMAVRAFLSIAMGPGWPAAAYLAARDELLDGGWVPQVGDGEQAGEGDVADPRSRVADRIIRPEERNFAFSETFELVHPDQPDVTIQIQASESHDGIDHENNLIAIGLSRIFWNVAVTIMSSEALWRASSSRYSRQASYFTTLNSIRNASPRYLENRIHVEVSGNSESSGRDGHGKSFGAQASGSKLVEGETPITFSAKAYSRML